MKTWKGICLDDHVIEDGDKRLKLKRGQEYDLGIERDGQRFLFSSYWTWVPAEWFGGIKPGYGHD